MKAVVVYYSYDGNSELIAKEIQAAWGTELIRLTPEDEPRRQGLAKYIWGGRQVFSKRIPKLKPINFNTAQDELLILGTPVWAGSPSPALNAFLQETKITGKRIALFCCHAGGKGKVFDKIKAALEGNTFAGEIDFINPSQGEREAIRRKIGEWLKTLEA